MGAEQREDFPLCGWAETLRKASKGTSLGSSFRICANIYQWAPEPAGHKGMRWWLMWGHPRPCHHGRHAALLRARQRFVTSSLISDVAGDIMGLLNLPVAGGNEILPVMLGAEPVLAVAVPSCPLCVAPPAFLGLLWVFSGGPGTSPGC